MKKLLSFAMTAFLLSLLSSEESQYFQTHIIDHIQVKNIKNSCFFLTYPRSGTNLLISSYQYFFKQPFLHFNHKNFSFDLGTNRLNLKLDLSKKPIYRTHKASDLDPIRKDKNFLIYIIRDFHECILRQYIRDMLFSNGSPNNEVEVQRFYDNENLLLILQSDHWKKFKENLELFDKWDDDKRILFYYEDLINDLPTQLRRLANFLHESERKINLFDQMALDEEIMDKLKLLILNSYENEMRIIGGSMSKGKDPKFHSRKISKEKLELFDLYVIDDAYHLWKKYLQRYAVNALES
jgi:hypothetical protein